MFKCKKCKCQFQDTRPKLTRCKKCYESHRKENFKKCSMCAEPLTYGWQTNKCSKCYQVGLSPLTPSRDVGEVSPIKKYRCT